MKINLNESLTGFQRTIQHLDGRHVLIRHPADQPITPSLLEKNVIRKKEKNLFCRFNEKNIKSRYD